MKRLQTWNFVNFNNAQTLCYPHYPDFDDSRRRLVSKFLLLLKLVLDNLLRITVKDNSFANLASSSVWISLIGYIQQCLGWCIAKLDLIEKSQELLTYWLYRLSSRLRNCRFVLSAWYLGTTCHYWKESKWPPEKAIKAISKSARSSP